MCVLRALNFGGVYMLRVGCSIRLSTCDCLLFVSICGERKCFSIRWHLSLFCIIPQKFAIVKINISDERTKRHAIVVFFEIYAKIMGNIVVKREPKPRRFIFYYN